MHSHRREPSRGLDAVAGLDFPTGLELVARKAARSVISLGDLLQRRSGFFIAALGDQELWRLGEMDECDAQNTEDHNEGAVREPDIAPAHILRARADFSCLANELREGEERPCKRRGDHGAQAPPARHHGQEPLVFAGQEFEEHGRVQDDVATAAKAGERDEDAQ